jgi:hypothetical protein
MPKEVTPSPDNFSSCVNSITRCIESRTFALNSTAHLHTISAAKCCSLKYLGLQELDHYSVICDSVDLERSLLRDCVSKAVREEKHNYAL